MNSPYIEVLLEGASDVPVLRLVLSTHFNLNEGEHFRLHPHHGKGRLPTNPRSRPELHHRGLLDQLPAKLRGFGKSLPPEALVLVVVDVDEEDCRDLLARLRALLSAIEPRPRVLFRLAIEETESWFLADAVAIASAFPTARTKVFQGVTPDAVVGAWELLARALDRKIESVTGRDKYAWAEAIAPHLELAPALSPSLERLLTGVSRYLEEVRS